MPYRLILLALLSLLPVTLRAQADAIVGEWWTEERDSRVQIYRTVKGTYDAKIVWIDPKRATEPDGSPAVDDQNPDPKLRTRPIQGLVFSWGFKHNGGKLWADGQIYDPNNGKTYSAKMTLVDANTLDLRGFVGISLIGRTSRWTRYR